MRPPSAFVLAGALLVLGTAAGMATGTVGAEASGDATFGTSGVVAVILAWAAFAANRRRAAGRAVAGTVIAFGALTVVIVGVLASLPVDVVLPGWVPEFEVYRNVQAEDEVALAPWIAISSVGLVLAVGFVAVVASLPMTVFGVLSRSAATPSFPPAAQHAFAGLAALPVLAEAMLSAMLGLWAAALAALVAAGWLVWALRRARHDRGGTGRQVAESPQPA